MHKHFQNDTEARDNLSSGFYEKEACSDSPTGPFNGKSYSSQIQGRVVDDREIQAIIRNMVTTLVQK